MQYRIEARKPGKRLRHYISFPFIWLPLFFVVILDLVTEIYHHIGFRLYGIDLVKRSDYVRIDRQHLKYLHPLEKLSCMYCGYINGWLAYGAQIAGETELYWCAIKHKKKKGFHEPLHHKNFVKYGDEKSLTRKYGERRN